LAVSLSTKVVGHINEVTLHRAGWVLTWVTILGYTVFAFNKATETNSAWSSLQYMPGRNFKNLNRLQWSWNMAEVSMDSPKCTHTDLVG